MGSSQSSKLEEQILTLQIENEKLGKENDELKLSKSNCKVCEPCNYFQYVTKSEYNDLNNKNIECQASNSILEDSLKTLKEKSDSVDKQLKDLSDKNTSLASDKAELESKYNDIVRKYNDLIQKYGRGDDERSDDMKLNGDEVPDETPDEVPDIKSDETPVDTPDDTPDIKSDEMLVDTPVEVPDDKESYSFKKNDVVKIIVIIILLIFSLYMVYICYKNEVNEVTETNEENEIM